jgi:23S rRNA (guanine2445-N2)-methyltransferase / 23S rRNA (guanine2069-N7)-methyltransferase
LLNSLTLFITGHKGFETLLFHEIRQILHSCDSLITKQYGGIEVIGDIENAYRVCLHSRLANRVFCQLKTFKVDDEDELYKGISDIDWSEHFGADNTFAVSATLSRSNLDHTHYASLKIKDAIVDQFRERLDVRPTVERNQPDVHIHINVHKNQAKLSLDLSGESLHKRGYRSEHSGAPLKEHLAASMIAHAGWNFERSKTHRFIDPMCGSGTFAIEAAMIAANIPPGLDREYFGFLNWNQHEQALWESCLAEAEAQVETAVDTQIHASDYDANAIRIAKDNADRAGVEEIINFSHQEIAALSIEASPRPTIIVCNPPYGERLQSEQGLASLYGEIGNSLKRLAPAELHIISANPDLLHRLRLSRHYKKTLRNGPIDCLLASFLVPEMSKVTVDENAQSKGDDSERESTDSDSTDVDFKPVQTIARQPENQDSLELKEHQVEAITPLLNRLQKNSKHLRRWAKRNEVNCYRVYDADLPEFSFALDVYQSEVNPAVHWYHLQEYQAPKTIEESIAEARIELAKLAVKQVFEIEDQYLFCKTKKRQRGKQQHEKQDSQGELFQVREGDASLLINLSDYMDSGLFLDHRLTRQLVANYADNKTVLNLFCYTGSAGVHAALGDAKQVLNVDMSTTYLKWAEENYAINQLADESKYQFLRADVVELLNNPTRFEVNQTFDLILLDPPSFSNSSKMIENLDILRDQEDLIEKSMNLLSKEGLLIFFSTKKGFKISPIIAEKYDVKEITRDTIAEDFKRRPSIHKCWEIRR